MSSWYRKRPSELMGICEPYLAYCFDEACLWIKIKIEEKKKPNFAKFRTDEENEQIAKRDSHYKSFGEFAAKMQFTNAPQIVDNT